MSPECSKQGAEICQIACGEQYIYIYIYNLPSGLYVYFKKCKNFPKDMRLISSENSYYQKNWERDTIMTQHFIITFFPSPRLFITFLTFYFCNEEKREKLRKPGENSVL